MDETASKANLYIFILIQHTLILLLFTLLSILHGL